jgi:hypothetical protein
VPLSKQGDVMAANRRETRRRMCRGSEPYVDYFGTSCEFNGVDRHVRARSWQTQAELEVWRQDPATKAAGIVREVERLSRRARHHRVVKNASASRTGARFAS